MPAKIRFVSYEPAIGPLVLHGEELPRWLRRPVPDLEFGSGAKFPMSRLKRRGAMTMTLDDLNHNERVRFKQILRNLTLQERKKVIDEIDDDLEELEHLERFDAQRHEFEERQKARRELAKRLNAVPVHPNGMRTLELTEAEFESLLTMRIFGVKPMSTAKGKDDRT